ncbi:tetratricopeptide repeat protein [Reichenbachiella ulvae]|uniref:Tetratricopeptide repeat protein n=1 Tax=Reichenbachiella ulvae TaxID=2980104 RepID=A0ABT3CTP8_9BACT|nr:tetratricopeptide repeat protein [Reichenbachiella ulvae]MCV9387080.1 tetratricopeptide repeat protein [Reichenbachiella ulvae]
MRRRFLLILPLLLIIVGIGMVTFKLSPFSPQANLPESLNASKELLNKGQYDSAIFFAKRIIEISKNPVNLSYANSIIGYSWFELENLDSSYFYYTKAIENKEKSNPSLIAGAYNMVGLIFEKKQTHGAAIKYFKEAIDIYEKANSKRLPVVYYNLAYNQSQSDNIDCIKSYYKALEYASKFEDLKYESYCLADLGNLMLETKNFEAAKEYFVESLDNEYAKNNPRRKAFALQGLGETEYFLKDYSSAKIHALEVLKLKRENNIEEHLFTSYYLLGRIYRDTDDLIEAENNLKRALIYYHNNKRNKKSVNVFKDLSDVQFKLGKTNQAEYHNQLHYEELERMLNERKEAYQLSKVAI